METSSPGGLGQMKVLLVKMPDVAEVRNLLYLVELRRLTSRLLHPLIVYSIRCPNF